jgi:hypothetical protein
MMTNEQLCCSLLVARRFTGRYCQALGGCDEKTKSVWHVRSDLGQPPAASDLTGQWAGLAPDGLVFPSASGLCGADLTLA